MFDGIKDTLNRFREDVEEAADEEPADEAEDPDEQEPDADVEPDGAPGTEPEPEPEPDPDPEGPPESDPETDVAADDEDEDGDGGGHGTGLGRKARSLARGRLVIDEDDLEGPLRDLELALLQHDVEMDVAQAILEGVEDELLGETRTITTGTRSVVEDALRESLLSVVDVGQFDFEARIEELDEPVVIVFTGVNGVGKTTTIAKVARYLEERGYSTVLANGDTYRAGANEQLGEHADRLGKKLIAHEQGGDPAAVIYDAVEYAEANDVDVVLGDTAGRLHTDQGLMDQLAKIDRVVGPDLTLFVDEAVAGQDAVQRAKQFDEAAEIDGAILTKADADASGGAAISIAYVTGKPILFLGTGQGYGDLEPFDPEALVDRLLEA